MHGRKRATQPPTPEQAAAAKAKLEMYKKLAQTAIQQRLAHACSPDVFDLNGKLCAANPDVYSLWNHRREMLLQFEQGKDMPGLSTLVTGELTVSAAAIHKNPKSYPAWQHRKWVVGRYHLEGIPVQGLGEAQSEGASSKGQAIDINSELALCGKLLDADERNFHCWNYRMWLTRAAGVPDATELEYTAERIRKNFSNYSAWHQRSHLLLSMHSTAASAPLPLPVLEGELVLIRQAVYTEPDDQSPWFYRAWLVAQAWKWVAQEGSTEACRAVRLLLEDLASLRELSALEPGAKWPLIAIADTLALLQSSEAAALVRNGAFETCAVALSSVEAASILDSAAEEADVTPLHASWQVQRVYTALAAMDPRHAAYYKYKLGKIRATQ